MSAMTSLATETLGSNAATVSFTNISQLYKDLYITFSVKQNAVSNAYWLQSNFNDDSNANYDSATHSISSGGNGWGDYNSATLNRHIFTSNTDWNGGYLYIPNYTGTTGYKITYSNATSETTYLVQGYSQWRSTSAITKISFSIESGPSSYSFLAGTTFALYGIG